MFSNAVFFKVRLNLGLCGKELRILTKKVLENIVVRENDNYHFF